MKKLLLFILSAVFANTIFAKELIAGWYIKKENPDTIKCQIEVPKNLDLFDKVSMIDSLGNEMTFQARNREIVAFGFKYKGDQYNYILKRDMTHPSASFYQDYNSSFCFLQLLVRGPKLNLYSSFSHSGGSVAYKWLGGSTVNRIENYFIEDMNKNKVSVYTGTRYKKDIKEFLNNDEHLINLFDQVVLSFKDIPRFVSDVNNNQ